jgi:hypothetical protein
MLSFTRRLVCIVLALGCSTFADTPLTTIQDILYTATGGRFTGVVTITWKSFDAADTSNVTAQAYRVQVSNGILYVQLIPTTNATTTASYSVQYSNIGGIRYSEVWVVPPSATPLRVRDVRLAPGTVMTPGPPAAATVQIGDVVGLQSALSLRLAMGTGFAVSRAAVLNAIGSVDGAVGNLTDCLHVDGSSGACGTTGGVSSVLFVDSEVPAGAVNGSNVAFALASMPTPSASVALSRNGLLLKQGVDYTLSSNSILFLTGAVPQTGDSILASYRLAGSLPGVSFIDGETPAGTIDSVNNIFTLSQSPNPAASLALFRSGLRLKSGADFTVSGNTVTFVSGHVPQTGDVVQCSYRVGP